MSKAEAPNNFNLLRLTLAWLVIVSHSYEMLDGTRAREPLSLIFGTWSAGDFAVNSFFVLSGCLIAKSWRGDPSTLRYLMRRVARIVPGFLCCVLFAALAYTAFFDHGYLAKIQWPTMLAKLFLLQAGGLPEAFPGTHYSVLNQSLWTIHYEFLCYIALMLLGRANLLRNGVLLPLWLVFLVAYMVYLLAGAWFWHRFGPQGHEPGFMYYVVNWLRFAGCYLAGMWWALNETRVKALSLGHIAVAAVAFVSCMSVAPLHVLATSVLLVPLLHYLGQRCRTVNGFWRKNDISYGVYLYAWPVQKMLSATVPAAQDPLVLILLSTVVTMALAALSWLLVERPAMHYFRPGLPGATVVPGSVSARW